MQARLHQSQRGKEKVGESIICIKDKNNRLSAELKEDQEYMNRIADEECHKMLNVNGARIAVRVVEAHKTHFETSEMTFVLYTSDWNSWCKEIQREIASAVCESVF